MYRYLVLYWDVMYVRSFSGFQTKDAAEEYAKNLTSFNSKNSLIGIVKLTEPVSY